MRHRLKLAAFLLAAALIAAGGAYRWPISSAYVRAEFGRQLADAVGLTLRGPARAYLSLLPLPAIQLVDAELDGADGAPVVAIPHAKARIALGPLLAGRLRLSGALLRRPTVLVDLDRPPFARDSALAKLIANAATASETPLGALRVEGGLLHVVSRQDRLDTLFEDVSSELDWPRFEDPARLALRATWRGAPITIAARLDAPAKWLSEGGSPASVDVSSPLGGLKLSGALKSDGKNAFEGEVDADFASTDALARLFGGRPTGFPPNGRLALRSKIALAPPTATLSDMRLAALGQNLDGALALTRLASGWSLSGSLAADALSLDDLFAKAPPLLEDGRWSAAPLSLGDFGAVALDLRASIAQISWRGHALRDAALSLMAHDGRVTATLSEATAYKGLLKGEATIAPNERGLELRVSASLANADIGALIADFGGTGYSGQGGGQFSVQASGDSPAALARALHGDASIAFGPGVIDGVSFEEALRRSERRPINLYADMRAGRTVFDEVEARATIENGEAQVRSAAMIGPGVLVTLNGGADLAARRLDAEFIAARADQHGAPDPVGPEIHVTISGPWARPVIKTNAGA